jgi:hypothetical protein
MPYAPESPLSIYNVIQPAVAESYTFNQNNSKFTPITDRLSLPVSNVKNTLIEENSNNLENGYNQIVNPSSLKPTKVNVLEILKKVDLKKVLIIIWLLGAFIITLYTLWINLKLWFGIKKHSYIQEVAIENIFNECKHLMKVDVDIPILSTKLLRTPTLFGFIRPMPQSKNAQAVWAEMKKEEYKGFNFDDARKRLVWNNPGSVLEPAGDSIIEFTVNDPIGDIYFTYLSCERKWIE